jgi:hypothetical protein
MTHDEAVRLTALVKSLHRLLATEGPTERTGRVLRALAGACEPAKKFVAMWDTVATPFWRRNAAVAALGEAIDLLK